MFINIQQDSENEVLSLFHPVQSFIAGNECSSILFWHENIPESQHMTEPPAILQPHWANWKVFLFLCETTKQDYWLTAKEEQIKAGLVIITVNVLFK